MKMDFKFIIDENIPITVIKRLRQKNYKIISVREVHKGIGDAEIIKLSKENQHPILTLDKDFGYLTYHVKLKPFCTILLRINPQTPEIIYTTILHALDLIEDQNIDLRDKFIVTDGNTLRIRKF